MKYAFLLLKHIAIALVGGSLFLTVKAALSFESSWSDLFVYLGALCGSLGMDLFQFFRRRRTEHTDLPDEVVPDFPDDVMEAINQIYEKHIDYTPTQRATSVRGSGRSP